MFSLSGLRVVMMRIPCKNHFMIFFQFLFVVGTTEGKVVTRIGHHHHNHHGLHEHHHHHAHHHQPPSGLSSESPEPTVTSGKGHNLCSTAGLCCPHRSGTSGNVSTGHCDMWVMVRSSRCVVQEALSRPCYCDKSCTYFRDCCEDYRQFCRKPPVRHRGYIETFQEATFSPLQIRYFLVLG